MLSFLLSCQSAFFDFCAGNRHQIVARMRVEAVKVTPETWIAGVEVAKLAQRMGLLRKCGTNCTIFYGLVRVQVDPVKMAL